MRNLGGIICSFLSLLSSMMVIELNKRYVQMNAMFWVGLTLTGDLDLNPMTAKWAWWVELINEHAQYA